MVENNKNERSPSSLGKYLLFGAPRFGTSAVLGIVDFALLTLYTVGFGVPAFQALFALGMGKLCIAGSQFFLGWISDAKYTKWGRRKPYLIIMSPLLCLSFIFLLLPNLFLINPNANTLFMWMLLWDIIFQVSYGVTTPYQSWMAEQFEVGERPKASQYQNIFNFMGSGVMTVFTFLILTGFDEHLAENPGVIPADFLITVIIFGLTAVGLFYIVALKMPIEPRFEIKSNIFENLKEILKDRNYLLVNLMQGIASLAWGIVTPTMLTFAESVLHFGMTEYIIVAAIMVLGILGFLILWRKLLETKGKKWVLLHTFLLASIILPFSLIGLIPMDSYFIFGLLFIAGLAGSLGGWYLFPYIIYADLAENNEKVSGELKAGIYTGFPSILLNIFQFLGLIFSSLIAFWLGDAMFYVLWGPICSVILIGAFFYTKKFVILDFDWEKKQV